MLIVFWALYCLAAAGPLRLAIYLFFLGQAFGSFNTIPGNITLTPAAVAAPLLVVRVLLRAMHQGQAQALVDGMLNVRKLGLLTAFVAVALLITVTAPALFPGVPVMGLNTGMETGLAYSPGNITQTIYLLASFFTAVAIFVLMLDEPGQRLVAEGLVVGGIGFILTGALDMLPGSAGFLAPFRTATYVLMAGAPIGDFGRVVGLSTEASSFGFAALAYGAFNAFLRPGQILGGAWAVVSPMVAAALIGFVVLSTSSSAYLGLGVMVVLGGLGLAWRLANSHRRADGGSVVVQVLAALLAGVAGLYWLAVTPGVLDLVWNALDAILFQKASSSSYLERSSWNHVSLAGLEGTYGFGLGVGATRASSWLVALVAGAGVMGAALMAAFILRCLLAPMPAMGPLADVGRGAKLAWLVLAVPAAGIGSSIDFGYANAVLYAVMVAVPVVARAGMAGPHGKLPPRTIPHTPSARRRPMVG